MEAFFCGINALADGFTLINDFAFDLLFILLLVLARFLDPFLEACFTAVLEGALTAVFGVVLGASLGSCFDASLGAILGAVLGARLIQSRRVSSVQKRVFFFSRHLCVLSKKEQNKRVATLSTAALPFFYLQ